MEKNRTAEQSKAAEHRFLLICAIAFIFALSISSVARFVSAVRQAETDNADKTLLVTASNGAALIRLTLDNYLITLKTAALSIEQMGDLHSPEIQVLLNKLAKANDYERLSLDFPNGTSYISDNTILGVTISDYLEPVKQGSTLISNVRFSWGNQLPFVSFFVPIHDKGGAPVASLHLAMQTSTLSNALDLTMFNSEGYYQLIDENGNYVAAGSSDNALIVEENFFDVIDDLQYQSSFSSADIYDAFTKGTAGYSKYAIAGHERFAYFEPVGVNNWVMMTIVPKAVINKQATQTIQIATAMAVQLGFILLALFFYILFFQRKRRLEAVLNEACFRALAKQTKKAIFEWDFSKKRIVAMSNFEIIFGRELSTRHSSQEALTAGAVHQDDAAVYQAVFQSILAGENVENVRYRVRHMDGSFHWCVLSAAVIRTPKGTLYKAIGSLENINETVLKEELLKKKAEKDQLTGLYNKVTTELLIKQALESSEHYASSSALMIIDIDDFKSINDRLGHQFGDAVLVELSSLLTPLFRATDIVGRIGGDEFFVFLRNYGSQELLLSKAKEICEIFDKVYSNDSHECRISASIGISVFPVHGTNFETLYKRADIALYLTKERGKNHFTIYDGTTGGGYVSNRTKIENSGGAAHGCIE